MVFVCLMLVACNRETLKFFFDGVEDRPANPVADSVAFANQPVGQDTASGQKEQAKRELMYHPDFKDKQCSTCHSVNSSNRLVEPQPALCYQCHDSFAEQYQVLHGPVDGGYCTACHHPHKSEYKSMLRMPAEQQCVTCHEFKDVLQNESHEGIDKTECLSCHDPHGGDTNQLLN